MLEADEESCCREQGVERVSCVEANAGSGEVSKNPIFVLYEQEFSCQVVCAVVVCADESIHECGREEPG